MTMQSILLANGEAMPKLGMGTWYMGEDPRKASAEIESLRLGVSLGIPLIDTAEMYGDGLSEELVGQAIAPLDRGKLFLVSKVYPFNAGRPDIFRSCEDSLRRLGTDYLDLYLLHWRGSVPLRETVECMEELKASGKIRMWGVSNFDTRDMRELWKVPGGENCVVNQVLYHLGSRGIEYELLPWMREHRVAAMGYCPLAQKGTLRRGMYQDKNVQAVAARHNATPAQILLAFALRQDGLIPIPKAGTPEHLRLNAAARDIVLSGEELALLEQSFPAPRRKLPLDIV